MGSPQPFTITNAGQVAGGYTTQPCSVSLHGWAFNNTAGAAGSVAFYVPANTNGRPLLPSAGGTLLFTIDLAATASKEFALGDGIYFKDGLYVISSAATSVGVLFIS